MGDLLEAAKALDDEFHIGTYARKPVLFVEGSGMRLTDDEGRRYLDFVSGLGVVNLGHSHPAVSEAVCDQISRLTHVSNLYHVEHQGALAEALSTLAGGGRKVFFGNSGAEANEGAIKLARRWGKKTKSESCTGIVTALGSFHGRTLATLAATGQPAKHGPFEPMPAGFSHVPLNDLEAMEEAIGEDTCAVLLEPIQGEGGVHPCEPDYLEGVAELCADRGVLFMLDEVQTGLYRTGSPFAHHLMSVRPDVFTVAKALANGLPAGAVVADSEIAGVFGPGDHGTTFGGGPVVCAAALATLAALETEGVGENATRMGDYLSEGLRGMVASGAPIEEIRGIGLMVGIELTGIDAAKVADDMLASGIVVNNIGSDIIRFLPPLVCTEADIDEALGALSTALDG